MVVWSHLETFKVKLEKKKPTSDHTEAFEGLLQQRLISITESATKMHSECGCA